MPMVWYIPPLSPVVDVVRGHRRRRRGPRQPVRGHRRAAHPGGVPRRTSSPPGTPRRSTRVLRKLAAMRSYMRDINLGPRRATPSIPAAVGMTGGGDVRDVPAARDRQVRRALRHPGRPRRAGPRPRGARHRVRRSTTTADRHGRPGPVRRGLRATRPPSRWRTSRCCRTGRPSDTVVGAEDQRKAGSTSSTGTARAPRMGSSPGTPMADRGRRSDAARGPRGATRAPATGSRTPWAACSAACSATRPSELRGAARRRSEAARASRRTWRLLGERRRPPATAR